LVSLFGGGFADCIGFLPTGKIMRRAVVEGGRGVVPPLLWVSHCPLRKIYHRAILRIEQDSSIVAVMNSAITTQTAGPGLRERKKLETKQALALAAMRLAVERGLENVRVQDIADAVNVSRRTFTNYFSGKEEAIASLNADRFAMAAEALASRPAGEPLADSLAEAFAAQYEAAAGMDRARANQVRMMMTSPALQGEALKAMSQAEGPLAKVIAGRIGADPQDLYVTVLAAAVMAAVRAATAHWMAAGGAGSMPDLIRRAVRQVAAPPAADATPAPGASPGNNQPGNNQPR
jgi:AcrR family transcriptional regulator